MDFDESKISLRPLSRVSLWPDHLKTESKAPWFVRKAALFYGNEEIAIINPSQTNFNFDNGFYDVSPITSQLLTARDGWNFVDIFPDGKTTNWLGNEVTKSKNRFSTFEEARLAAIAEFRRLWIKKQTKEKLKQENLNRRKQNNKKRRHDER